ncbi:hypothetical protein [Nocardia sp. NPDC003345]
MSVVACALIAFFIAGLLLLRFAAAAPESREHRAVRVRVRTPRPPGRR